MASYPPLCVLEWDCVVIESCPWCGINYDRSYDVRHVRERGREKKGQIWNRGMKEWPVMLHSLQFVLHDRGELQVRVCRPQNERVKLLYEKILTIFHVFPCSVNALFYVHSPHPLLRESHCYIGNEEKKREQEGLFMECRMKKREGERKRETF